MDLRQLRYFVGVVEAGSFTKAARRLHIAQSALSLHVRRMEEAFGVTLLLREQTGIRPTDAGTKLLEHAQIILRQFALAERDLQSQRHSAEGVVTIGIPSGLARVLVSELLAATRAQLPRVSLQIVEGMTGNLEDWLTAGRLDLAVLYRDVGKVGDHFELAREDFHLVAAPQMAPPQETIALSDLRGLPLVLPMGNNNGRRSVSRQAERLGWELEVKFEVDSLTSIIKMVTEAKAYSVLTPPAFLNELRLGLVWAARVVQPEISRSVILAVYPREGRKVAVSAIKDLIGNVARQLVGTGDWPARVFDPH
ncbi:MAG: LysR family transcriptional regulator [Hyphomicrobiales bacterium]|nr:LysR family transcriptional regulator [Hyphomicrobiales bacterium]